MFPKPWHVMRHERVLGAKNGHGVPTESFAPGERIDVLGWSPPAAETEPFESGRGALIRDLDVYGDAELNAVGARDRVSITVGHYAGMYEVVGDAEDFSHGPFGFTAGSRLSLKMVEEDAE